MIEKSLNSINNQSYKNLQKILINGGNPPHQTSRLKSLGVNLSDWEIVDFPTDCMDIQNNWELHRWNGAAALHVASGDFFFALNDDDFLSADFFLRINNLLDLYPNADSAMGLRVTYNHETGEYGEISHPVDYKGRLRPQCEPGINLIRELFFRNNLAYGPSLGFQPVLRTSLVKELGPDFFYKGFYPDCGPYFQIVCRSDTIFDSQALMYWGIHEGQDHIRWDLNNFWNCKHEKVFSDFKNHNLKIFLDFFPHNYDDARQIKKYFEKRLTAISVFAISTRYLNFKSSLNFLTRPKEPLKPQIFPLIKHLSIILKRPKILTEIIVKTTIDKVKNLI